MWGWYKPHSHNQHPHGCSRMGPQPCRLAELPGCLSASIWAGHRWWREAWEVLQVRWRRRGAVSLLAAGGSSQREAGGDAGRAVADESPSWRGRKEGGSACQLWPCPGSRHTGLSEAALSCDSPEIWPEQVCAHRISEKTMV